MIYILLDEDEQVEYSCASEQSSFNRSKSIIIQTMNYPLTQFGQDYVQYRTYHSNFV